MSPKASQSKMDYITRYDKETYDRVLIRFPKGTKEKIQSMGLSVNGFTVKAVIDRLQELENNTDE